MALHTGNGCKFMNLSTNRLAYEGPVVEETAAILKAVDGGGIVVTSVAAIDDLMKKHAHKVHELPEFRLQDVGDYLLPKVQEPVSLLQIMPKELSARPATSLSGCIKLSCSYAEAPGAKEATSKGEYKGDGVAFVFCTLKTQSGGADVKVYDSAKAESLGRRSSAGRSGPRAALSGEAMLSDLLRTSAYTHRGYITKTSKGVSLVAFHTASEGLRFVRDIAAASVLSNLTFAAGLHFGAPSSVQAAKAGGRGEYIGAPVNTSARVMALVSHEKFKPNGTVAVVSAPAWEKLDAAEKGWLTGEGKFPLKGVAEPMDVYSYSANTQQDNVVSSLQ